MEQYENEVIFHCSEKQYHQIWYNYFDLDNDYSQYKQFVPSYRQLFNKSTVIWKRYCNIKSRCLGNNTFFYYFSTKQHQKNTIHYRIIMPKIWRQKKTAQNGTIYYTFPTVQSLQFVTEKELQNCNLGYRSKYIVKIVNDILQKKI